MDFIHINHCSLIFSANKVATPFNLFVVKNYIKNTISVDLNNIQSKLYLKILYIPYLSEETNMPINLSIVESIIKNTHIFSNIHITSRLCIIKVLSKSDIAIVWINANNANPVVNLFFLCSNSMEIDNHSINSKIQFYLIILHLLLTSF